MNQSVRIIGGKFRGKKLFFPDAEGLRPTPDRVRETLFNWLMPVIRDTSCLDAFAGSGALGFEAFSRGASHVTLIDSFPLVCASLQKTATTLNTQQLDILKTDVQLYLQKTSKTFDIIFLDPPFASNHLIACINDLEKYPRLKKEGLLYIESDKHITLNPLLWREKKIKKAGQVFYALYEKL